MITSWLLGLITGFIAWAVSLLPTWDPPAWLLTAEVTFRNAIEGVSAMGYWLPIGAMGTVAAAVLAAMALGLAIRITRIVLSFLTAGGGSAA